MTASLELLLLLLVVLPCIAASSSQDCDGSAAVPGSIAPEGICVTAVASLERPRGILALRDHGDVLVVDASSGEIHWLDPAPGGRTVRVARWADANLGIVEGPSNYVLVSGAGKIARFRVTRSQVLPAGTLAVDPPREVPTSEMVEVMRGIPTGGHSTRTLALDEKFEWLYVQVGSAGNVDDDSGRSRIVRFRLAGSGIFDDGGPQVPLSFNDGEVFADGLRNEAALTWDANGVLWGAENGVDNLFREDLGGDIHTDNPAEEVNAFLDPAKFYGYPFCWTEFLLPSTFGKGRGTQWAHSKFINDGTHTDAWCQDEGNVVKPVAFLPAHTAPLGMLFYSAPSSNLVLPETTTSWNMSDWSLPLQFHGDLVVALHGSWNRSPPQGYRVMRIPMEKDSGSRLGVVPGDPVDLIASSGDRENSWGHRPVGVAVGPRGDLLVTSDASSTILSVRFVNRSVIAPENPGSDPNGDSNTSSSTPNLLPLPSHWGVVLLSMLLFFVN